VTNKGDEEDPGEALGAMSEPAWSDAFAAPERPSVEKVEACIAAGDPREAVLQCAALVDVRLSALGADTALAALLVGTAGPQWMRFQNSVHIARSGQAVAPHLATECFAFALETSARCDRVVERSKPTPEI
jgi:hypothetical protein